MTTLRIPAALACATADRIPPAGERRRAGSGALGRLWRACELMLLGCALLALLTVGLLPRLGLYRPLTVLSASMRPTFAPGDMAIVRPEPLSEVRVGQVISYRVPVGEHQVETHRVVRVIQGGAHPVVQTKGDANAAPDPWIARLEGDTAWRQVAVIPRLGFLVNALRGPSLQLAATIVAPALLALLAIAEIWGLGRRRR